MSRPYHWHGFAERGLFTSALAQRLAWDLQQALQVHDQVSLGVSGGSTPLPAYRQLAQSPLPWNRIRAVLVDERFVAADHADSNERALRECFAPAIAQGLRLQGLRGDAEDLESAAEQASRELRALPRGLDVLLLGMGEDGHTASLFPTAEAFDAAIGLDADLPLYAMQPMPAHAPHPRLSMSLSFLRRSACCHLAISGDAKRAVLEQAAAHFDPRALPISAWFQPGMPALDVFWSP